LLWSTEYFTWSTVYRKLLASRLRNKSLSGRSLQFVALSWPASPSRTFWASSTTRLKLAFLWGFPVGVGKNTQSFCSFRIMWRLTQRTTWLFSNYFIEKTTLETKELLSYRRSVSQALRFSYGLAQSDALLFSATCILTSWLFNRTVRIMCCRTSATLLLGWAALPF